MQKYDKRDETTKQEDIPFIAEAYAIRGICYFDLVRLFENIPLVTTPNGYMSQQADVEDVYRQIAADLLFATQNGPEYLKDGDGNRITNRITKYAAEAYVGKVYLFHKDFYKISYIDYLPEPSPVPTLNRADAVERVKDCVDNSRAQLNPDYRSLFASSCATFRRVEDGIVAQDGDLDALLYSDGQVQYLEDEHVFTIKNNCETLSEPNN